MPGRLSKACSERLCGHHACRCLQNTLTFFLPCRLLGQCAQPYGPQRYAGRGGCRASSCGRGKCSLSRRARAPSHHRSPNLPRSTSRMCLPLSCREASRLRRVASPRVWLRLASATGRRSHSGTRITSASILGSSRCARMTARLDHVLELLIARHGVLHQTRIVLAEPRSPGAGRGLYARRSVDESGMFFAPRRERGMTIGRRSAL